jgi:GDP-mannose 6-dehydrogenase
MRRGRAPVVEEGIGDLTAEVISSGQLDIADDAHQAVLDSDISVVCVGTPSAANGGLNTAYLERVSEDIGRALREKRDHHVIVYRSTMVPGTCEELLMPILERASGKRAGVDFGVCVNPEYLREGTSIRDFLTPAKTVVGQGDPRSGDIVMAMYADLPGERFQVPIAIAEMSKYIDNSFHALKVTFGNEIGAICRSLGLDSHAAMDIFLTDTKLNISPAYLRPGFAFGGSCLPKDLRALVHVSRKRNVDIPLIAGVLSANEAHLRRAVDAVMSCGRRRVGMFGLSFKAGTDDLRESPLVELAERLIGKGYDLKIFDSNVAVSRLFGANRAYIDEHLPHIGQLIEDDLDAVLEHAEICVVGSRTTDIVAAIDAAGARTVIDLVRLPGAAQRREQPGYLGIGW